MISTPDRIKNKYWLKFVSRVSDKIYYGAGSPSYYELFSVREPGHPEVDAHRIVINENNFWRWYIDILKKGLA